jgi:dynein intermediate chain 3, axonemal
VTGEMGLTRLLFNKNQTDTFLYCSSDEGDLILIDWSVKPPGDPKARGAGGAKKEEVNPEYILHCYKSERNLRPVLELARSPFYEDLILTVHDFYFCIWKISMKGYEFPIFRSSYT